MFDISFISTGILFGILHHDAVCEDGRPGHGFELLFGFFAITCYFPITQK